MSTARALQTLVALAVTVFFATPAAAFCGFYVAGSDAELFNDATQVAMVRDGTRTVLSMQNNYRGPAEEFAMVVPVPEVLDEDDVKVLDAELFRRLDTVTAPRLVEYWEENPCPDEVPEVREKFYEANAMVVGEVSFGGEGVSSFDVTVEASYSVGEYDIEVLSAEHSAGLYAYLRTNRYNVPNGAAEYLQPYIEQGAYFFVARVDPERATFEDGQAVLSPLRFTYSSEQFQLPIRLGMINSAGAQDLIIYLLGRGTRFEVANYPNVFIPTNIEVTSGTRDEFGTFYRALFDRMVAESGGAVVTEYAWGSSKCDPCPEPVLDEAELFTLGVPSSFGAWTITRLHARYEPNDIGEDLVFRGAEGVRGGVPEVPHQHTERSGMNQFQGRYIIRHRWMGPVTCANPQFGNWGGEPRGDDGITSLLSPNSGGEAGEDAELEDFVEHSVMAFDLVVDSPWWASEKLRTRFGLALTALLALLAFLGSRAAWRRSKVLGVIVLAVGLVVVLRQPMLETLFMLGWWTIFLESLVLWNSRRSTLS